MENKLPHDSDFEQFVQNALNQTKDTPDDLTWTSIAAQQANRNVWLRLRHYGLRWAPVLVVIAVAIAGWKYYSAGTAAIPTAPAPEVQPSTAPSALPQANSAETALPGIAAFVQNGSKKVAAGHLRAAHLNSSVPATSVRFAAEQGLRYENPATGTRVYIPANALLRADGSPATGEVEFELREYRNAADFLASGIPMHYADERGSYFFNSGGMFDLRVYQGGEALQMASGEACDVQFASTHKLTQPSLYYFDETDNAWKYRPDEAMTTAALPPVVKEATAIADNRGLQQECLPEEFVSIQGVWAQPWENEAADWMKVAVETGYDYAFGKKTMPGWFRKHSRWTNEQLLTGMEHSVIRMKRHKDTDDMFFPEDMNNVFTELKAFKDCYFIINTGLGSKKSFTKEELGAYWDRCSVVQENGATCYISFFGKQGLLQFYATLIGSTENKNFDAEKVLAEYNYLRNQRQQNFEQQANSWRRFAQMAQIFQAPEEWCMDPMAWFDYFEANLPLMRKRYAGLKEQGLTTDKALALQTWENWNKRIREIAFNNYQNKGSFDRKMKKEEGLVYALRVTNFGLYNCDQIFRLLGNGQQEAIFVLAGYKSSDGQRIVPKVVSVMERRSKQFFTLPKSSEMVYAPGRRFDIIVLDDKGRYFMLPGDKYAQLDLEKQKSYTFTVDDVTDKTKTPREWAEMLNI